MFNQQKFAERFKEARTKSGLSRTALSKKTGISTVSLAGYESTDNPKIPSLDKAQQLAEVFGVSLDWLCGNVDKNESLSVTNFSAETYLKSLAIVIAEMTVNCRVDDEMHTLIDLSNPNISRFAEQVKDLIKVHRNGSLTNELYEACIDKLVSNYSDCSVFCSNFLDGYEAEAAWQDLCSLFDSTNNGVGIGIVKTQIYIPETGKEKELELFIDDEVIKEFDVPKGAD